MLNVNYTNLALTSTACNLQNFHDISQDVRDTLSNDVQKEIVIILQW